MKKAMLLFLISILVIAAYAQAVEAKSQSFTIKVSCIVPERLEMTTPEAISLSDPGLSATPASTVPTRIQTQETKFIDGRKTLVYTVVDR